MPHDVVMGRDHGVILEFCQVHTLDVLALVLALCVYLSVVLDSEYVHRSLLQQAFQSSNT